MSNQDNRLRGAVNFGTLTRRSWSDRVGATDPEDLRRFVLQQPSQLSIVRPRNAAFQLYTLKNNWRGREPAVLREIGNQEFRLILLDKLKTYLRPVSSAEYNNLQAGVYFTRIFQPRGNVRYSVTLTATPKDTQAPIATLGSVPLPSPNTPTLDFSVTYTDNVGLNSATFDSNDIVVVAPNGALLPARYKNVVSNTVTYSITAPGNSWDNADIGTYTVRLQPGQVRDTSGNVVASIAQGSFKVLDFSRYQIVGGSVLFDPPSATEVPAIQIDFTRYQDSDPGNNSGLFQEAILLYFRQQDRSYIWKRAALESTKVTVNGIEYLDYRTALAPATDSSYNFYFVYRVRANTGNVDGDPNALKNLGIALVDGSVSVFSTDSTGRLPWDAVYQKIDFNKPANRYYYTQSDTGGNPIATSAGYTLPPDQREFLVQGGFSLGESKFSVYGNSIGNLITGSSGSESLYGFEGNDALYGLGGDDKLYGGLGSPGYAGGRLRVEIRDDGLDYLDGGDGNDYLVGEDNNDYLIGGIGNDSLYGDWGSFDGEGNDYLDGGEGNDSLYGNAGSDALFGRAGNDILVGFGSSSRDNRQIDTLTGGGGSDTFVVNTGSFNNAYEDELVNGIDNSYAIITDWDYTSDYIQVTGSASDYSIGQINGFGSTGTDTAIRRGNNIIAIIQDSTNVSFSRDFRFS